MISWTRVACSSMFLLISACGGSGSSDNSQPVSSEVKPTEPDSFLTIDDVDYDNILIKANAQKINIYVKSENSAVWSNHFIEYELERNEDPSKRMDVWRLVNLYDVIPSKESEPLAFSREFNGESIVTSGEWECAIIEDGANDFMGGYHGYEELESYALIIDGERVTDFDSFELIIAKELIFKQESSLISQLTGDTAASHVKEFSFTSEGLDLKQTVGWLDEIEVKSAYLTMFPIKRTLSKLPEIQVTDEAQRESTNTYEYIATKDFSIKRTKDEKVFITGDDSGFYGNITLRRNINLPNYSVFVSNASQYNKVYFDFSGKHKTVKGESWETNSTYDLYINRDD